MDPESRPMAFYAGLPYSDRDADLRLDVLAPPRELGAPLLPVVIYFHGGGWHEGDRGAAMHPWLSPQLASRGYVAISVSYRLSGTARWPAQYEDARDALLWVTDHAVDFGGDPARVGVWGFSAGAHLAAHLAVREPGLVKAAALAACPVELQAPGNGVDNEVTWLVGASPSADVLADLSPLTWVTPRSAPALIVHGTDDQVVDFSQGLTFRDALRAAGARVELLDIPGAGHEWADRPAQPEDQHGDFGMVAAQFFDAVL
ncbi:acetyl esterase/lipase [Leifsonia sp. AK011]|uniref:alpha/beta hydrolase n=1 Tax=Leifsonia sp. AK011 TaxID=2723075 RepID=UPI0015C7AB6B|nr:alpha/beta hydrolase [Leifsonia sp. AK011]NYF09571.1 acetyl esterase/lipase [Leifsonia sp. AK011]